MCIIDHWNIESIRKICHFLTTESIILTWVWFHFVLIILLSTIFLCSLHRALSHLSKELASWIYFLSINFFLLGHCYDYRNPLQCPLSPHFPHSFFAFTFFSSSPIILLHCSWLLESIFCNLSLLLISQSLPLFPTSEMRKHNFHQNHVYVSVSS